MGSSKKHKEKRDRKKHKKGRSKSRDRDTGRKTHKSSHRSKEKKHSPANTADETEIEMLVDRRQRIEAAVFENVEGLRPETPPEHTNLPKETSPDLDLDIEQMLDSKLTEKSELPEVKHAVRKKRKEFIEEFKRRQIECKDQMIRSSERPVEEREHIERRCGRSAEDHEQTERVHERLDEDREQMEWRRERLGEEHDQTKRRRESERPVEERELTDKRRERPVEEREKNEKRRERPVEEREKNEKRRERPVEEHEQYEKRRERPFETVIPVRVKEEPIDIASDENREPQLSLSISETNKLRAKLGLKPLDVGVSIPGFGDDNERNKSTEASKPAEVFVKTENMAEKKRAEDLREKLKVSREKRKIEEKLRKTKRVGDSDSEEESTAEWVKRHQKVLEEKERAAKRAKLLEEMDEEFGIGALLEEEFDKKKAYTSRHLKGLTISHDVGSFREGQNVILTLKDKDVLNEDEDVLENVNILDDERYAKNVENKKNKPDYKPYEEPEYDEFGILKKKSLLSKYDEEIEGQKKQTFKIGNSNPAAFVSKEQELELIRMKLKQQSEVALDMPQMKVANEYYTSDEMVLFRKPKKKKLRKIRKLKADDLAPDPTDYPDFGSRKWGKKQSEMEVDDFNENGQFNSSPGADGGTRDMGIPFLDVAVDTKTEEMSLDEDATDLNSALHKARKLKGRFVHNTAHQKVLELVSCGGGGGGEEGEAGEGRMELNSVAEFCRTLGEIPTYGMAGNRDQEADDMQDLEREILEEREKEEIDAQNRGAWNEVDIDEKPAEISMRENEPILEEEPDISCGIAGALKLATKKGYLDKDDKKLGNAPRSSQLQAQSYTIEEKFYEDDKFGKRDRYTGPTQEFREKCNYKPDVKLEYIDDSGRLLNSKEAFRYLSHKFHGKGPGKNKVDKRMKKVDQDTRLKQMSSTDTPLNTVKLLQAKQKETQSPYIVLSGGNKTLTQTMISKVKPV